MKLGIPKDQSRKLRRRKELRCVPASSRSDFSMRGGSLTTLSNLLLLKGSSFGIESLVLEEHRTVSGLKAIVEPWLLFAASRRRVEEDENGRWGFKTTDRNIFLCLTFRMIISEKSHLFIMEVETVCI